VTGAGGSGTAVPAVAAGESLAEEGIVVVVAVAVWPLPPEHAESSTIHTKSNPSEGLIRPIRRPYRRGRSAGTLGGPIPWG
jgi:hypothetical protein